MSNYEEFSPLFQASSTLNSLILMGGRGTRLENHRKIINPHYFPTLKSYWGNEGPKALTTLTLHGKSRPLLDWHFDLHCQSGPKIDQFYLGLGFAGDMIEDYLEDNYAMNYQSHPLIAIKEKNPAGTLTPFIKMFQNNLLTEQSLVLANGDNFIETDLYAAYLEGLSYAKQQNLNPNHCVILIASPVDHHLSSRYGVISIDHDRHIALSFSEKRAVEENPFELLDGKKTSWINSGFSIIVNPLWFAQNFITQEIVETSQRLEEGTLDYKSYEKQVKYETVYEQIAQENHIIVVKQNKYWADSGNEELIKAIEEHYKEK